MEAQTDTPTSRRESKLKYKYGITLKDYEDILKLQKGVCAICKKKPMINTYLSVDHDHKTGKVRGLLCYYCNTGLGMFKDNSELLKNAADYLSPPSFNG